MTRAASEQMRLRSTGMEFASEMVAIALRHGLRVAEIPITYYPRGGTSKLRSFRDGWRHLRFMLLLSPTPLFLVPGLLAVVVGLLGLFALLPGPIRVGALRLDYHFMFVASALAILGVQLVFLGLAAKTYSRGAFPARRDPWVDFLDRRFTLERGLVVGLGLAAAGLGINAWILWDWLAAGRGQLFAVQPALLGLSLIVVGTQTVFGSFFISVLRDDGRR
jgi:hypothetical protein